MRGWAAEENAQTRVSAAGRPAADAIPDGRTAASAARMAAEKKASRRAGAMPPSLTAAPELPKGSGRRGREKLPKESAGKLPQPGLVSCRKNPGPGTAGRQPPGRG